MNKKINQSDESKTETISIRIDAKTLGKLRKYSKSNGMSLNSAISALLTFDVEWNIPSSRSGWVPIPRDNLIALMEKVETKDIEEIAKKVAKKTIMDIVFAMTGKFTVKNTLDILAKRSIAAGFYFNEIDDGDEITFVMQHNLGRKWSFFFETYYQLALQELGCISKFSSTDNTVTYTINKSDYK